MRSFDPLQSMRRHREFRERLSRALSDVIGFAALLAVVFAIANWGHL